MDAGETETGREGPVGRELRRGGEGGRGEEEGGRKGGGCYG